MAVSLLICNSSLTPVADPIVDWTTVDATAKWNDTGSGTFTAPATPALAAAVTTPGNRVVLLRDGTVFSSGPIEEPGEDWDAAKHGLTGYPDLPVQWADSMVQLARHLTYPDPTLASTAQTTTVAYTATATNAETVMRNLVNLNCGPGALTARQEPRLFLGTALGVGTTVNVSTRFERLTDVLRAVALAGGNLGFRVREDMHLAKLWFEVFAPTDRSASIRFSKQLNNLRSYTLKTTAPSATVAIVGGDGTGTSRAIVERINTGALSWGRWEVFVNQAGADGGGDAVQQQQAGDKALTDGGEVAKVTVVAAETATQKYNRDFFLGDKVSVQTATGIQVVDIVSAAHLTATPDGGDIVQPVIGLDTGSTDNKTLQKIRDLERRTARLERG